MLKNGTGLFGGMPMAQDKPFAKKPNPSDKGDGLRRAAGIFADFAAGLAGQPAQYAPMMERRRQESAALAQYQQQRADEWADWQRRQEYERANPAPAAPDAFERSLTNSGIVPGTPEYRAAHARRAEAMSRDPNDEFVAASIPGVGTYVGPRSGMEAAFGQGGQSSTRQPTPEAIAALRRGEGTAEQFDEWYGPGSAARVMGGTAGNGGGNFPGS